MKKNLFLLMALFAFSSVNAQVKIGGSMSNHIISFHVEDANKGKLNMTMIFQDNYNSLPANPVLLIKLMDNTVIELKGKRTRNEIITNPDLHQRTHNDAATFTLTKDQFNKMSKGVKKLPEINQKYSSFAFAPFFGTRSSAFAIRLNKKVSDTEQ